MTVQYLAVARRMDVFTALDNAIGPIHHFELIGNVFYLAVEEEGKLIGAVCSVRYQKSQQLLAYELVKEHEGPTLYGCPKGLLNRLTATDNPAANEWREKCKSSAQFHQPKAPVSRGTGFKIA